MLKILLIFFNPFLQFAFWTKLFNLSLKYKNKFFNDET